MFCLDASEKLGDIVFHKHIFKLHNNAFTMQVIAFIPIFVVNEKLKFKATRGTETFSDKLSISCVTTMSHDYRITPALH